MELNPWDNRVLWFKPRHYFALCVVVLICALSHPAGAWNTSLECQSGFREDIVLSAKLGTMECSYDVVVFTTKVQPDQNGVLCYLGDIYSHDCTTNCTSSNTSCNGDSNYCKDRSCTPSPCYCRSQSRSSEIKVDCGDGYFIPDGLGQSRVCTRLASFVPPPESDVSYVLESDILDIVKQRTKIHIKIRPTTKPKKMVVYKKWFKDFETMFGKRSVVTEHDGGEHLIISVDPSSSSQTVSLYLGPNVETVMIGDGDTMVHAWSRLDLGPPDVDADDYCYLGHCDYCESNSQWANCRAYNFGYIKIGLIFSALILTLCLLPWILACCSVVVKTCKCMFRPMCSCLCACCKSKSRVEEDNDMVELIEEPAQADEDESIIEGRGVTVRMEYDPSNGNDEGTVSFHHHRHPRVNTDVELQESRNPLRVLGLVPSQSRAKEYNYKVSSSSTQPLFFIALMLFALPAITPFVSAQCSTSIMSASQIETCTNFNASHSVCKFYPVVSFSLNGVGSRSCVAFTQNGTVVGTMDISFDNLQLIQSLVKDYYTSCWTGLAETSKSCFLEACCTYGSYGDCSQWNPYSDPNPCNKFSQGIMSYPGLTGCHSGCGCAGCGCFSCANSCMYNRYSLQPTGDIGAVYSFGLQTVVAKMTITTKFKSSNTYSVTSQSPLISNNDFSATLQGVFIDFATNFGDKKLLVNYEGSRFVDAAVPNIPSVNVIGDIQSDFPNGLSSPNPTSFKFPSNVVDKSYTQDRTIFAFKPCGYQYKNYYGLLPASQSGFVWTYDSKANEIKTIVNRFLSAMITVTMKKTVDFYQLDDVVCPVVTASEPFGCYQCTDGAGVTLTLKSDCFPGTCIVKTADNSTVVTNTVFLSKDSSSVNITFLSGAKELNTKIIIDCGRNKAEADLIGSLVDKGTIYENKNDTIIAPPASGSSADLSGLDFFGIGEAASQAILAIIIIIGVALLFFVVAIILWKCLPKCKGGKERSFGEVISMMTGAEAFKVARRGSEYQTLIEPETEKTPEVIS